MLRIIGHDCGHEYFAEDAYSLALAEYDAAERERADRNYLSVHLPELPKFLVEAWFLRRDLRSWLRIRDEIAASITKKAVAALLRSRQGNQLFVETDSELLDDRGNRIVAKVAICTVNGLDAFGSTRSISVFETAAKVAAEHCVIQRDEQANHLETLSREQAKLAVEGIRSLLEMLPEIRELHSAMCGLLLAANLKNMSRWGMHRDCREPFWIEPVSEMQCYVGKGVKPLRAKYSRSVFLPPANSLVSLTLE